MEDRERTSPASIPDASLFAFLSALPSQDRGLEAQVDLDGVAGVDCIFISFVKTAYSPWTEE
jgi:hypothetical protein